MIHHDDHNHNHDHDHNQSRPPCSLGLKQKLWLVKKITGIKAGKSGVVRVSICVYAYLRIYVSAHLTTSAFVFMFH